MSKRIITDIEIALIKVMLTRGMTNRDNKFHFNNQDLPVNSGRIMGIRDGTFELEVPKALDDLLNEFLVCFKPATVGAVNVAAVARGGRRFGFWGLWRQARRIVRLPTVRGSIAASVLDERINRDAFDTSVATALIPELRPGDIVVMDTLSSHKGPRAPDHSGGGRRIALPPAV